MLSPILVIFFFRCNRWPLKILTTFKLRYIIPLHYPHITSPNKSYLPNVSATLSIDEPYIYVHINLAMIVGALMRVISTQRNLSDSFCLTLTFVHFDNFTVVHPF